MKERIAIISGYRTPFCKADTCLKKMSAEDLGAFITKELLYRINLSPTEIDEVIVGNVAQPAQAMNIARVISLKAGLPIDIPSFTVHRNCASGMESMTSAANKIIAGEADTVLAVATESMTHIPLLFNSSMTHFFKQMLKKRSLPEKLAHLLSFRPKFLSPVIGLKLGLTDPVCGLLMGVTAENLADEFSITRKEQDIYALNSHLKAAAAMEQGFLDGEIIPTPIPNNYRDFQKEDNGVRKNQNIEALQKLSPYFKRKIGTVTVGNSSQVTDGACATLLMKESLAKEKKLPILGFLRAYSYAGLDGKVMGLGPIFATDKLLKKTGIQMQDFDLFEMNEAFAAQIIANLKAFESLSFCKKHFGRDKALGTIDPELLNINGGGIALGHPVGASGLRIVITLLRQLKQKNKNLGLASLCIGGGQGAALALEVS